MLVIKWGVWLVCTTPGNGIPARCIPKLYGSGEVKIDISVTYVATSIDTDMEHVFGFFVSVDDAVLH